MRATKAMPLLFNKKICMNGKRYCDSYVSISTKLNALKAIELGANRLIVIDNELPNFLNELVFSVWIKFKNKRFRKNYSSYLDKINKTTFPGDIKIIFLRPKNKLNITTLGNSKKLLKDTISQGFKETCKNSSLRRFIAGLHDE